LGKSNIIGLGGVDAPGCISD